MCVCVWYVRVCVWCVRGCVRACVCAWLCVCKGRGESGKGKSSERARAHTHTHTHTHTRARKTISLQLTRERERINQLYFTRVVEKTGGLFTSIPCPWGKLLLNKYTMSYSMLSTLMYIHTNHAEMNTSEPRNKSIMSMKYIYIS